VPWRPILFLIEFVINFLKSMVYYIVYRLRIGLTKVFKWYCILYCMLDERVVAFLKKDGGACTQREIGMALPNVNRAVLLGYLRCLVDVGKIKSKDSGKAKIYFL